jgi:hypothetical protein
MPSDPLNIGLVAFATTIDQLGDQIAAKKAENAALRAQVARLEGALRGALDGYDEVMAHIGGCSDGHCLVVRPPKGSMVTNGGCRCTDNRLTARRIAGASSRLRHVLREALSGSPAADVVVPRADAEYLLLIIDAYSALCGELSSPTPSVGIVRDRLRALLQPQEKERG